MSSGKMYSSQGIGGKPYFRSLGSFLYIIRDKREEESPYNLPRILSLPRGFYLDPPQEERGEGELHQIHNSSCVGRGSKESNSRPQKVKDSKSSASDALSSKIAKERKIKMGGGRRVLGEIGEEMDHPEPSQEEGAEQRHSQNSEISNKENKIQCTCKWEGHSVSENSRDWRKIKTLKSWQYKSTFPMMLPHYNAPRNADKFERGGSYCIIYPKRAKLGQILKRSLGHLFVTSVGNILFVLWQTKCLTFHESPKINVLWDAFF